MPTINIFQTAANIQLGVQAESSEHLAGFLAGASLYSKLTANDSPVPEYKIFNDVNSILGIFDASVLAGTSSGFAGTAAGFSGNTDLDKELHSMINYLQYGGILVAATGATQLNNTNLNLDSVFCQRNDKFDDVIRVIALRKDCIGVIGSSFEYHSGSAGVYPSHSMAIYDYAGITGIAGVTTYDDLFFSVIGRKKIDRLYGTATGTVDILMTSDAAGLMARTDAAFHPWIAPAGVQRGQVQNLKDITPKFGSTDVETLNNTYGINSFIGVYGNDGVYLMGNATAETTDTDRMYLNISRLLVNIKRSIKPLLESVLFEINNAETRSRLVSSVSSVMERIRIGNGVSNYTIICDESNNTESIINSRQLVLDVTFKPYYAIETVTFRFAVNQA